MGITKIAVTPLVMSEEEAWKCGRRNWLAMLFSRKKVTSVDLRYFPYYRLKFDVEVAKKRHLFSAKENFPMDLEVIVSGTAGQGAIIKSFPALKAIECDEEKLCDPTMTDAEIRIKGHRVIRDFIARRAKTTPDINKMESEIFYRPYWLTFYGERVEGQKLYYVPLPADGYNISRGR